MPLDSAKKMAAYRERKRRGETLVTITATPALKLAMLEFGMLEKSQADDSAVLSKAIERALAEYLGSETKKARASFGEYTGRAASLQQKPR
ncbi:hypothetical protein [Hwanghaeella sp. 1Z406]|uniref:hypothetical protein n=1 Tax=Hwanghaeella sp. 1Z406 TaxID=3402811 RepID=UPI003B67362A